MEMELIGAFEFARQALLELRRCKQPRHFPLVLGGQQLMIGARDDRGQRFAQARVSLRRADAVNELAVPRRVSRVAIVGQMLDATREKRVERGRFGSHVFQADQRLDAHRIMAGAPAPFERLFVGVDGDAVELDCAIDRLPADRNQPPLPGRAEHEHVGGDRVPHERRGQALRVDNERLVAQRVFKALDQVVGVHAPVGIAGEIRRSASDRRK